MIVLANEKNSSTLIICLNCFPVSRKKAHVPGSSTRQPNQPPRMKKSDAMMMNGAA